MPYQAEILRVESPELMAVIREAAEKIYKKNRGDFSVELRIERIADRPLLMTLVTLYILKVGFTSGVFGSGETRFEFADEDKEHLYRVAADTIQAWSNSYFVDKVGDDGTYKKEDFTHWLGPLSVPDPPKGE